MMDTEEPLGNLICYKDEIITHSADSVATYFQIESLRTRVARQLKKNADDSWALARQGELFLHDGEGILVEPSGGEELGFFEGVRNGAAATESSYVSEWLVRD